GSLPPGLVLDPTTRAISGTPNANGTFAFTLQVTDASGGSATRDYTPRVSLPPLPSVSMDGLPDPANAADQPAFSVSLPTSYPVQLTGQIAITFNFPPQSAKGEVTATSSRTLHVLPAAPVTRTLQVVQTAGGFELHTTGYSTPCQLTQAVVQFTPSAGSNLQTTQLTIPLSDLAASWFQSAASGRFGSQFTLVLPFTVQGNAAAIDSVGVTLVNKQGSSPGISAKF